jgi:hypothetical protein
MTWPNPSDFRGAGSLDAWFSGQAPFSIMIYASSGKGFGRVAALELRAYLGSGNFESPPDDFAQTDTLAASRIALDGTLNDEAVAGYARAWLTLSAADATVRDGLTAAERADLMDDYWRRVVGRTTVKVAAWFATARTVPLAGITVPVNAILPVFNAPPPALDGVAPATDSVTVFDPSRGPATGHAVTPSPAAQGVARASSGPGPYAIGVGLLAAGGLLWAATSKPKRKRRR